MGGGGNSRLVVQGVPCDEDRVECRDNQVGEAPIRPGAAEYVLKYSYMNTLCSALACRDTEGVVVLCVQK